jgi:hypothetical protein
VRRASSQIRTGPPSFQLAGINRRGRVLDRQRRGLGSFLKASFLTVCSVTAISSCLARRIYTAAAVFQKITSNCIKKSALLCESELLGLLVVALDRLAHRATQRISITPTVENKTVPFPLSWGPPRSHIDPPSVLLDQVGETST